MTNQKTNIFDLVEEVNRNKNKSAISKEKEVNDIFSMLDEIKEDNDISVEKVRSAVNSYNYSKEKINDNIRVNSSLVKKPSIPSSVNNWNSYSECVVAYLNAVDYGDDNSQEYVRGHKSALSKYADEVLNNRKDVYVVEGHVNEEINSFANKSSLESKGYYDGLFYVLKALKKAKEDVSKKIVTKLREKLF